MSHRPDEQLEGVLRELKSVKDRLAAVEGERMRRRLRARWLIAVAALAATGAFAQLVTFTANSPARADQVNANFTYLLNLIIAKVGAAGQPVSITDGATINGATTINGTTTTGLRVNGTIYSDYPGSAWDLWIQGGGTATAGTARNLALLGDSVNDRLVLNHAGEYTGGTRVESALTVTGGLNGAGKLCLAATDCGWEANFFCGQQGFCSAGKVMMGIQDGTGCGVGNSAYCCRLALSTGCPP